MSKKKNNNQKNYPFSNEVKQLKAEFKSLIDSMSDDEFLDLIAYLSFSEEDLDEEIWALDEGWEDEAEKFYNQNNDKNNNLLDDNDLPF